MIPKAGFQVIEKDGVWVVELACEEIKFLEHEPLPEKFATFDEQQKKYWSLKIFSKLEKKLKRKLKEYAFSKPRKSDGKTTSHPAA